MSVYMHTLICNKPENTNGLIARLITHRIHQKREDRAQHFSVNWNPILTKVLYLSHQTDLLEKLNRSCSFQNS